MMNIKKFAKAAATAVTSGVLASSGAVASGYDSVTWDVLPQLAVQVAVSDIILCGTNCTNQGGSDSKSNLGWSLTMLDVTFDPVTGAPIFNGLADGVTANGDGTYTFAGASPAAGGTNTGFDGLHQIVNLDEVVGGLTLDFAVLGTYQTWDWNVQIGADGRILQAVDSYFKFVTTIGADDFVVCIFPGNQSDPALVPAGLVGETSTLVAYSGDASLVDCETADFDNPVAGTNADSYSNVFFLTCDVDTACASSAKAVPVPAFAAATLGLGLLGVTLLTSRRKTLR